LASETVRVSRETKRLLEELRARIVLETGRRPSIQEIVDAAVAIAAERRDELLRRLGAWRPLTVEEAERLLEEHEISLPCSDVVEDMERALYGERHR
jgi:hypothetical protein